ncbi:uncharacterized protein LOC111396345 [Olea europaea subsp. europaea]|uniref:Uncharacterized protein LOC111396345 n=1 Tax=Olea europaea subsp. europaea TaxID=158383 RepID=A0A8S0R6K6_OLEEU|nr:uncharacterized protein LOC111396345 [Olea europaea subsp. europaea]
MVPAMFRRGKRLLKQSNSTSNARLPVLVALLLLILVALALFGKNADKSSSMSEILNQKWNSFDSLVRLDPNVEFRNGTDFIWQIPDSPKAVLFLAHGCNGRAANFWDKSPKCSNCVGLPEERLIVLHALARNFAVLTISSNGRCWSLRTERRIVKDIIESWVVKQNLEKLPLFALGASSGGYFVSVLATDMRFRGITLMIAEGVLGHMEITKDYPPILFVHMPKDENRRRRIEKYLIVLREKGVDVTEIKCMEFPLTPDFFANRIPGLDLTLSRKLFDLFTEKGFIDKNSYMRDDGRRIPWKTVLQERNILLPDKSLVNHIQEEMNLAFAYHEMTSLQSQQIFDWFESHLN